MGWSGRLRVIRWWPYQESIDKALAVGVSSIGTSLTERTLLALACDFEKGVGVEGHLNCLPPSKRRYRAAPEMA